MYASLHGSRLIESRLRSTVRTYQEISDVPLELKDISEKYLLIHGDAWMRPLEQRICAACKFDLGVLSNGPLCENEGICPR